MNRDELRRFLQFQFDADAFFAVLDPVVAAAPAPLRTPALGFKENLEAVIATSSFASELVEIGVQRMEGRISEEDFLDESLFNPASELMRQTTILTWASLEVLVNDSAVALLNRLPDLSLAFMENERTKKRLQIKTIPLELLDKFSYNVSSKMGLLIFGETPISSAEAMRDVLAVLAAEANDLHALLRDARFWRLNQRRNLIVHRRGIVDEAFRSTTGENIEIGTRLEVTIANLQADLGLVRDIGVGLLNGLSARLQIILRQDGAVVSAKGRVATWKVSRTTDIRRSK